MARRPRVFHVVEAFVGGVARHLVELIEGLPDWEHTVCLSLARDPRMEAAARRLEQSGASVRRISMRRGISPREDLAALLEVAKALRQAKPAIVHGHSAKGGFLARAAARLAGHSPAVYTPHSLPFHAYQPRGEAMLYRCLERLAGHWTTALVAVSETEAAEVAAAGLVERSRIRVIHNAVRIPASPQREVARRDLGLPPDGPLVLCVAHLRPQKAPLRWLWMADQVGRAVRTVRFAWAGDGESEPAFLARAAAMIPADRFHYLGYQADTGPLYDAADIFTLASLWEGCPYALLDAMARALPCAVTEAASCGAIRHDDNGLLASTGQPDSLPRAVTALLQDSDRARALGRAAQETIRRHYSPEAFVAGHVLLYSDLLARPA